MQKDVLGIPGVFADPEIQGGQPILDNGIPIYLVLDMLAQGFSRDVMEQDYGITDGHVQTALQFAAAYVKREGSHAA